MSLTLHAPLPLPTAADAERLAQVIADSARTGVVREVLWLRRSDLPARLRAPRHLQLAADALAPMGQAARVQVFALANDDLVVLWRGAAEALVAACVAALRHMFIAEAALLPDPQTLLHRFRLPDEAAMMRLLLARAQHATPPAPAPPPKTPGPRLTLAGLAALEANLASADVARFARRRPVCVLDDANGLVPAWETRQLSVREIADTLAPGHDLTAEPWLFRRLTRSLDRRMLALLAAADELRDAGPFGLNLNIGSMLATEFLRFDAALPARLRGQVVLGLDPADLLADPAAFQFARTFARARHYRLMLRNLTPALLPLFVGTELAVDVLQLQWSEAWVTTPMPAVATTLLLSHTDRVEALHWGRACGIRLYQGALITAAGRGTPARLPS